MGGGEVAYRIDVARLDNFFDHLCWALFFHRYGRPFNDDTHVISHTYLSLSSSGPEELRHQALLRMNLATFYESFAEMVHRYEADRIGEIIYENQIVDPVGPDGSITIAHTFYGLFDVVSLLTRTVAA